MDEVNKSLSMIVLMVVITLIKIYLIGKMYNDLSGWTFLPALSYAQLVCLVFMICALKILFCESVLFMQAYELMSREKRITKALSELLTIVVFYAIYFTTRRFF